MALLSGQAATLERWFADRRFVVLDGGLATALEAKGHVLDDALWSARLLLDDPGAVRQVHLDYLAAGADCVLTASYQATLEGLAAAGASAAQAERTLRLSVELAREAVAASDREAIVAASVGPYGAYLADGSEYVGRYAISRRELADFHRPRWEILADSCDLLACETLPSREETEVLLELLDATPGVGAWFSFVGRDQGSLADGSPMDECAALCAAHPRVLAVGVNCTPPALVSPLIEVLRRGAPDLPIVVYPNSGETYDAAAGAWNGEVDRSRTAEQAVGWWRQGARLLGGCCRTGPADIRALAEALSAAAREA